MMGTWISLDYPPTANNLFVNAKGRGRVRSPKYDAWRMKAAWAVKAAVGPDVIEGPFRFYLQATRPDRRRRDIDNTIKPCLDALVLGCAVLDDSKCQKIEAEWVKGDPGVRVLVLPTKEAA